MIERGRVSDIEAPDSRSISKTCQTHNLDEEMDADARVPPGHIYICIAICTTTQEYILV